MDSFTVIEWLPICSACPKPTIERAFKVPTAFSIIRYSMSFFEKFSQAILPAVYLGALWRQTSKLVTIICSDSWLNISLYMIICVCIYSNLQCTLIGSQEVVIKPTYKKSHPSSAEIPSGYPFFKVMHACNHMPENNHVTLYLMLQIRFLVTQWHLF